MIVVSSIPNGDNFTSILNLYQKVINVRFVLHYAHGEKKTAGQCYAIMITMMLLSLISSSGVKGMFIQWFTELD